MPKLPARLRPRNATSAANGKGRRIAIVSGLGSRALWGKLDMRFGFSRAVALFEEQYIAHVGGSDAASVVQLDHARSASRHKAIAALAFARFSRLLREKPLDLEALRAAREEYRAADAAHLAVARQLGLERRAAEIFDIAAEVARQRQAEEEANAGS